jgi:GT2 family glycosyltransferase
MGLSVVYVNFNTAGLLFDSLLSLHHVDADLEVIVVDNASELEPLDAGQVETAWPGAKIIWSAENVGFGRGCNLGAEQASGQYLWLLNTDTLLEPDNRIGDLIAWLDGHPEYGAATPLLVGQDGNPQAAQVARSQTLGRVVAEKATLIATAASRWAISYGDHLERDVDDACAASLVVRADVFRNVGGFDPAFFFFMEDGDLCRKIWLAGCRIRHFTDARVTHLHGQSVKNERTRQEMYYRSLDIYYRKWRPRWEQVGIRVLGKAMLAASRE